MKVKKTFFQLAQPFNPLSSKQILAYLKARKIPAPKHRTERDPITGERKDSTNEEGLLELLREGKPGFGDKVLEAAVHARHLSKAASYLSEKYVHSDGRLHPIFTNRPKQRLASARPNTMNFPKGKKGEVMKEAAEGVLGSIIADEGWSLASCDWRALHPTLIGYFAGDEQYARVARLGAHAYVLSYFLERPVDLDRPDEVVQAELDKLKEDYPGEYKICKIGNLAYLYLQGITNMAKTLGLSHASTQKIRDAIDRSSPKVAEWKWKMLDIAHFQGKLVSPFGLPLSFFSIYSRGPNGKIKLDKDGKKQLDAEAPEAIAFMPLATESGMLREVLVSLGTHPEHAQNFQLLIPEHDKVILQIRDEYVRRILGDVVIPSMARSWPELGGLVVEVEAEVGKRLQECPKPEEPKDGKPGKEGCPDLKAPVCRWGHMKAFK